MVKKNTKPLQITVTKLSEAVLVYTGIDYLLRSEYMPTVFIVAFSLTMVLSGVAIWAWRNFVQPSAQAIIKNNK